MSVKYIGIFVDEPVVLEKIDGTLLNGTICAYKNDLKSLEGLSPELQDLHHIIVTLEGKASLDIEIKIKDLLSIERMDRT